MKMKTKYTKKQIQESIKYWKNQLKKMNESVYHEIMIGGINNIDCEPDDGAPILVGDDVEYISCKEKIDKLFDQLDDDVFALIINNAIIKCDGPDEVKKAIDYYLEGEKYDERRYPQYNL